MSSLAFKGFALIFPYVILFCVERFYVSSRCFVGGFSFPPGFEGFLCFPSVFIYFHFLEVDRVDYRCKHQTKSDNCIVGTVLSMTVRADSGLAFARPLVRCHVEAAATAINSSIMATILSCPQYFLYVNATNASVRASYYRHLFGLSDPPIAPYLLSTRAAHGRCRRGR